MKNQEKTNPQGSKKMSLKIPLDCATLVKDDQRKPAHFTVFGPYSSVLSDEGARLLASVEQAVQAGQVVTTLHDWTFVRPKATFVPEGLTRADVFVRGKMSTAVAVWMDTSLIVLASTAKGWILKQSGSIYKLGAHSGLEDPWQQLFQ
jgi:hypothetical protein